MTVGLMSSIAPPPLGLHAVVRRGDILAEMGAVFAIDAEFSVPGEQWAMNRAKVPGAQRLRARYGSVGRAEIRKGHGLVLPGVIGNYLSIPDSPALRITGDIDIVFRLTPDTWTPGPPATLLSKWEGGAGQRAFYVRIESNGRPYFGFTTDGTNEIAAICSAAVPRLAGQATLLRVARQASNGTVYFSWAPDGDPLSATWNNMPDATQTSGAMFAGTSAIRIGERSGDLPFGGLVSRVVMRSGIGGLVVLDTDEMTGLTDLVPSFTADHGYGVKDGAIVQPGVAPCYVSVPDSNALDVTGDIEIVMRVKARNWASGAAQVLLSKRASSNYSYQLYLTGGGGLGLNTGPDGTTATGITGAPMPFTNNTWYWVKATRTAAAGTGQFLWAPDQEDEPTAWTVGGSGTNTPGNIFAGTAPLEVGGSSMISNYLDGSIGRAIARKGIDGIAVLDVDPRDVADDAATFTAAHGFGIKGGALVLPAISTGQYASVPDSAAVSVTGDIEIVARLSLSDWTPAGGAQSIVSKGTTNNAASYSYNLMLNSSGCLVFECSDGTSFVNNVPSSTPVGAADGSLRWVKATCDLTNGTNAVVSYYTAPDQPAEPTTWTLLQTVTRSPISAINDTAASVVIGSDLTRHVNGSISRAIVRDGIAGATVLDVDFVDQPNDTQSFTCSTGQTVTVNGCALPTATVNGCARPVVTVTAANAVDTNDPLLSSKDTEPYFQFPGAPTAGINALIGYGPGAGGLGTPGTVMRYEIDEELNFDAVDQRNLFDITNVALFYMQSNGIYSSTKVGAGSFQSVLHGITGIRREKLALEINRALGTTKFFRWVNGAWSQLGATQTFTPGAWFGNMTQHTLMAIGSTSKVFSVAAFNDGVEILRYSAAGLAPTTTTFPAEIGGDVVINRGTAGRKLEVVSRALWVDGTDDFLQVGSHPAFTLDGSSSFAAVLVCRVWATRVSGAVLMGTSASGAGTPAAPRWIIRNNTTGLVALIDDGTTVASRNFNPIANGTRAVIVFNCDGSGDGVRLYVNGQATVEALSTAGIGSIANTFGLRVGGATSPDMSVEAAGFFPDKFLSDAEIAALNAHYGVAA